MAGSTTCNDVFWVCWLPNRSAAALLHNEVNIRNIYYYAEATKNYTTELSAPAYYTDALKYYSAPSYNQTGAPVYYTKATEYFTTTKGLIICCYMEFCINL